MVSKFGTLVSMTAKKNKKKKGNFRSYIEQRALFYKSHPRARLLLGMLIVVFAYFLGQLYWNYRVEQAIGVILGDEGIDYYPGM